MRGAAAAKRVLGAMSMVIPWLILAIPALATSPSPSAGVGGDPRSSGEGPGLVGDPLVALLAVVAIGVGALIVTLAYVRLTDGRSA